ncbi:MAG: tRNA pseudouridine(38-40) synthase TruA [Chloroflexi bacterium RBG_13_56_8b]|nr:MAG: tRNA pseudouridine(38-40) synthase TruA [Chloroflexi bacterium RBG_13_56_8b]
MEYDGTRYHGFQWQDGPPSIQGELEKALTRLTGERRRVISASRTDAGVHARGQVVSFRTGSALSTQSFVGGLNHYLPNDIAVKAAYRINDAFNVRREAISREYNYYILNRPTRSPIREGFAYLVAGKLDIEAMNQACLALVGEHDFASFAGRNGASVKSTVRRVFRAEVTRDGEMVIFNISASSFLLHQVRNTVGALIRVGLGKMTLDEFNSIIEARELALAGPTAPAYGLCLNRVNYPGPLENYDENL